MIAQYKPTGAHVMNIHNTGLRWLQTMEMLSVACRSIVSMHCLFKGASAT